MGTIVINQTDCKQNVVLQSSLDGITGGYYDAAGVWHELGGGFEYSFEHITKGSISDTTSANYFDSTATTRCGEKYFLSILPGDYEIEIESSETIEYAVNYYTSDGMDKVLAHTAMALNTNSFSLGWTSADNTEFTLPEGAFTMRLTFRHPDNSAFSDVPISKCVIRMV